MDYINIGKIIKPFGLKGEMKVEVYTDFIKERFKKDSTVYLLINHEYRPFKLKQARMHKEALLVLFHDFEDINLIEAFKGVQVYKAKSDIPPLKKGEYYFSDLENLDVYAEDKMLGRVLRVEPGIKHNFLRVERADKKTFLIPYIDIFIKEVDLKEKRIIINYLEGLL